MKRYFGGNGVAGGQIRELDAKGFPDFVSAYFDKQPYQMKVTREYFHSREKKGAGGQDELKDGPYVCACTFKPGETLRNDANAESLVLVCFDIDEAEYARPFFESPETLSDALYPYNFLCYTTATHTPDNPRVRILVDVEELDVSTPEKRKVHKKLVYHVARLLGLPANWKGKRESYTLSLPMYRPVQFEGEPFNSVLVSRTLGRELQLLDIPDEVEGEFQKTYAYQGDPDAEECGLAFLPIRDLEVEDLREALFKIDPDCDYKQWTEILTAFRHQFRGEEAAEDAFNLADEWSQTGAKYCEGDTYSKWQSFRPDPVGKIPVTIRTFFKYAQDAGWQPTKVAAKVRLAFNDWLAECEDLDELMREGPERIAAVPFQDKLSDAAMVVALGKRIHAVGKIRISETKIEKQISKLRHVTRLEADDGNMPAWLRPWCYITTLDMFYNTLNSEQVKPEAFNRTFMEVMMPGEKDEESARSGRPLVMPADFALNVKKIRRVGGIIYDPRHGGSEPFFSKGGRDFVNSYRPASVPKEDEVNSAKAGKILRRHIATLITEPDYQELLLAWMAFIVQRPGVKCRWTPIIQSAEGSGKGILMSILASAIGKENVKYTDVSAITSNFNDWGVGCQVNVLDEIRVQGRSRAEVMNKLKAFVSNDDVAFTAKFKNTETIENITNFIAFTNFHDALYLTETDRRYFVLKSRLQSKGQILELNNTVVGGKKYFELLTWLFQEHGGAVRHFLLNHTLPKSFDPNGEAPDTPYRRQMIEESKNPLQLEIESLIGDDDCPLIAEDVILLDDLVARTEKHARNNHSVTHFLLDLGYQAFDGGKKYRVNGNKSPVWVHRENFIPELGHPETLLTERYEGRPDETI